MEKIKTLTVGTDTYQLCDPEAARIDDAAVGETVWSSQKLVESICPAFEKIDTVVTCTPLAGTQISVVSRIEDATSAALWVGGKNLLDITALTNESKERVGSLKKETNAITITTSSQGRSQWGGRFIVPQVLWGKTLTFSFGEWSNTDATANPMFFIQVFNADGSLGTYSVYPKNSVYPPKGNTITFPVEDATYLMIYFRVDQDAPYSPAGTVLTVKNIQLEVGDKATVFEPTRESRSFSVDFGRTVTAGSYHWNTGVLTDENGQTIQLTPCDLVGQPGTNLFMGNVLTVAGRSDLCELLKAHGIQ